MSVNGLTFEMEELNTEGNFFFYIYIKFVFPEVFPHEMIENISTEF